MSALMNLMKEVKRQRLQTLARALTEKNGLTLRLGTVSRTDLSTIEVRDFSGEIVPGVPASPAECWVALKAADAHESGHVLFSDADAMREAGVRGGRLLQHILNVLEDARVERAVANLYPGTLNWFRFTNEYIYRNRRDWGEGAQAFLWGLCSYVLVGKMPGALDPEIRALVEKCKDVADEARLARNTREVLRCAERIHALVQHAFPVPDLPPAPVPGTDSPREAPQGSLDPRRVPAKREQHENVTSPEEPREDKAGGHADGEGDRENADGSDEPAGQNHSPEEASDDSGKDSGDGSKNEPGTPEKDGDGSSGESCGEESDADDTEPDEQDGSGSSEGSEEEAEADDPGEDGGSGVTDTSADDEDGGDSSAGDGKPSIEGDNLPDEKEGCSDDEGSSNSGDREDPGEENSSGKTDAGDDTDDEDGSDIETSGSPTGGDAFPDEADPSGWDDDNEENDGSGQDAEAGDQDDDEQDADFGGSEETGGGREAGPQPSGEADYGGTSDGGPGANPECSGEDKEDPDDDFSSLLEEAEKELSRMESDAERQEKEAARNIVPEPDWGRIEQEVSRDLHRDCLLSVEKLAPDPSAYRSLVASQAGLIRRLVEEIRKALEFKTTVPRRNLKKGRLDAGNLWKLRVPDPRVFSRREVPGDVPELAVYLLVDCSGSMDSQQVTSWGLSEKRKIAMAREAACALHEACARLNVSHCVVGFSSGFPRTNLRRAVDWKDPDGAAIAALRGRPACNRDGYAVRAVAKELELRPEPRKVLIVLSDGLPNDSRESGYSIDYSSVPVADTAKAVREVERRGIGVIGIFFGDETGLPRAQVIYNRLVYVNNIANLPVILGRVLKQVITQGA